MQGNFESIFLSIQQIRVVVIDVAQVSRRELNPTSEQYRKLVEISAFRFEFLSSTSPSLSNREVITQMYVLNFLHKEDT